MAYISFSPCGPPVMVDFAGVEILHRIGLEPFRHEFGVFLDGADAEALEDVFGIFAGAVAG